MKAHLLTEDGDRLLGFRCPGCSSLHYVATSGPKAWTFNGSFSKPTLSPSVFVHADSFMDGNDEIVAPYRCHSFVRDGRIEYLLDSTHKLAGQTVNLPEVD